MRSLGFMLVALFLSLAPLTACGKKPGDVDPPPGASRSDFPRTYPAPDAE